MAERKEKAKEIVKEKASKIYLGPSIRKYGLMTNTVYLGDFPSNVEEAIKEFPEIAPLFIEINSEFALKKGNIVKAGTRENILFNKILKKLGGK
ncbi:MAG: hypothetical protein SOR11_07390 [Fusobacterium sp.]|uniref:hypothetical protein n=1 Tax=Fusobacterium sp. TaxID=68766 RepID=UPI002A748C14|nr:hypothetical protein [Fusobacterium sp.]MCF2639390.1 hypothetical protein [Fusobacterium varium]MDY3059805.1 hypothetical protein [Fusobacterium sp.]